MVPSFSLLAIPFIITTLTSASTLNLEHGEVITLPRNAPIYVGELRNYTSRPGVYSHTLIAWLPSSSSESEASNCASHSHIKEFHPFSLPLPEKDTDAETAGLKVHDLIFYGYDSAEAGILRAGNPFATCKIGPTAVRVGRCPGIEGGEVWRKWTCWVDEFEQWMAARAKAEREREEMARESAAAVASAEAENEKDEGAKETPLPSNMANPPKQSDEQDGTYKKWICSADGCEPETEADGSTSD